MTWVVGLTGGIGSGKSAVAEAFRQLGAAIVDADAIAHELTGPGGAAMPEIRRRFGEDFVAPGGSMDRARMRALVFGDPEQRKRLEALLHPLIRAESERRIAATRAPYAVYVVPLLVESGGYRGRVQRVLVIDCPEDIQVERVCRRSGLSAEQARAIIRSQASRAQRRAVADDVIDNSGSLAALQQRVAELHQRYLGMARGGERDLS
jgi:dephospho-CoA kinase